MQLGRRPARIYALLRVIYSLVLSLILTSYLLYRHLSGTITLLDFVFTAGMLFSWVWAWNKYKEAKLVWHNTKPNYSGK